MTSVTIPDSVTSIGYSAFSGCSGLTSVTIGNGVTSIGYEAFRYCYDLTSVTIGEGVTSIGSSAFAYCYSLTSITIPDSVTSIGNYAFEGCSRLTSVTSGNGVTSIGVSAFRNCTSLTSVTFEGTVEQAGAMFKGSDWNYNCPFTGKRGLPLIFRQGRGEGIALAFPFAADLVSGCGTGVRRVVRRRGGEQLQNAARCAIISALRGEKWTRSK